MQSAEIARRYLAYFEAQGHTIVPSASLVADDPTLLFVVAGMQPFKPYLLGQQTPPFKRVADVQKCVRTLDIEEVGKTTRHATFFQMLGNWSFGDYFKEGAIPFAWELLTSSERDGGFGFPESKLWATVLHGDDEAFTIWRDEIGLQESRIQRRGLKDNYWHMGVAGPGGPCSEIYYDRGPQYGREGGPEADEGVVELSLGRLDETRGWWMKPDPNGLPSVTTWKVLGRSSPPPGGGRSARVSGPGGGDGASPYAASPAPSLPSPACGGGSGKKGPPHPGLPAAARPSPSGGG